MKPSVSLLAFRPWARISAVLLVLALGASAGCSKPEKRVRENAAEPESTATSEAAKTRELEDKAAAYKDRYQEIQDSNMTADEKAQAAGELVDEQQRTVREAEDGPAAPAAPADGGEAQQ